jgi:hypothetical protein
MTDDFDKDLEAALDAAEKALNEGPYKKAMRDLLALSMTEIKSAVPKTSYADYSKLLSVVEQASAANIAQADLKENIVSLGNTAINIAKLIPSLAVLFA